MRNSFLSELTKLSEFNKDIFLVVGDLGFSVVELFAAKYPNQFLNAGVAEQNMTGLAAGLASEGYQVFTYSIANFSTLRCLEQIRNDICHHDLPVTIVSVGGGVAYGSQGYSHYAIEDLAIMRALPGLTVVAPGDPIETKELLKQIIDLKKPTYLRLGKSGEPLVHQNRVNIELGKASILREGKDLTLISTGGMLRNTVNAANILAKKKIESTVLSMHTIEPLDSWSIKKFAKATGKIITVEEHGVGGLASCTALILAGHKQSIDFQPIYIDQKRFHTSGDQQYLHKSFGLDPQSIANTALSLFK